MMNFIFKHLTLFIFSVSILSACSKHHNKSILNNIYKPYVETYKIQHAEIANPSFRSILKNYVELLDIFENGVNYYCDLDLHYYIIVHSFCRNDSSFIVVNASAESLFFDGNSNEINLSILNGLVFVNDLGREVLIDDRTYEELCSSTKEILYHKNSQNEEFRFTWYKDQNGNRLSLFYPHFFDVYYYNNNNFSFAERVNFCTPPSKPSH